MCKAIPLYILGQDPSSCVRTKKTHPGVRSVDWWVTQLIVQVDWKTCFAFVSEKKHSSSFKKISKCEHNIFYMR